MGKKNSGLNESVLVWFKRVHPEELWAVKKMPPALKFGDVLKSMEGGLGMGDAATCSDTMTREMILDRLAELTGETVRELVDRTNARFRERARRDYKARFSRGRKKLKRAEVLEMFRDAATALKSLAEALRNADCLALADRLGEDVVLSHQADLRKMESMINEVHSVLWKAKELL